MVFRRGQAAMEFLMTYGWAILVVLIVIGVMMYSGFVNISNLLPEKCTFSISVNCLDHSVKKDSIHLHLKNVAGRDMVVRSITATSEALAGPSGSASGTCELSDANKGYRLKKNAKHVFNLNVRSSTVFSASGPEGSVNGLDVLAGNVMLVRAQDTPDLCSPDDFCSEAENALLAAKNALEASELNLADVLNAIPGVDLATVSAPATGVNQVADYAKAALRNATVALKSAEAKISNETAKNDAYDNYLDVNRSAYEVNQSAHIAASSPASPGTADNTVSFAALHSMAGDFERPASTCARLVAVATMYLSGDEAAGEAEDRAEEINSSVREIAAAMVANATSKAAEVNHAYYVIGNDTVANVSKARAKGVNEAPRYSATARRFANLVAGNATGNSIDNVLENVDSSLRKVEELALAEARDAINDELEAKRRGADGVVNSVNNIDVNNYRYSPSHILMSMQSHYNTLCFVDSDDTRPGCPAANYVVSESKGPNSGKLIQDVLIKAAEVKKYANGNATAVVNEVRKAFHNNQNCKSAAYSVYVSSRDIGRDFAELVYNSVPEAETCTRGHVLTAENRADEILTDVNNILEQDKESIVPEFRRWSMLVDFNRVRIYVYTQAVNSHQGDSTGHYAARAVHNSAFAHFKTFDELISNAFNANRTYIEQAVANYDSDVTETAGDYLEGANLVARDTRSTAGRLNREYGLANNQVIGAVKAIYFASISEPGSCGARHISNMVSGDTVDEVVASTRRLSNQVISDVDEAVKAVAVAARSAVSSSGDSSPTGDVTPSTVSLAARTRAGQLYNKLGYNYEAALAVANNATGDTVGYVLGNVSAAAKNVKEDAFNKFSETKGTYTKADDEFITARDAFSAALAKTGFDNAGNEPVRPEEPSNAPRDAGTSTKCAYNDAGRGKNRYKIEFVYSWADSQSINHRIKGELLASAPK